MYEAQYGDSAHRLCLLGTLLRESPSGGDWMQKPVVEAVDMRQGDRREVAVDGLLFAAACL